MTCICVKLVSRNVLFFHILKRMFVPFLKIWQKYTGRASFLINVRILWFAGTVTAKPHDTVVQPVSWCPVSASFPKNHRFWWDVLLFPGLRLGVRVLSEVAQHRRTVGSGSADRSWPMPGSDRVFPSPVPQGLHLSQSHSVLFTGRVWRRWSHTWQHPLILLFWTSVLMGLADFQSRLLFFHTADQKAWLVWTEPWYERAPNTLVSRCVWSARVFQEDDRVFAHVSSRSRLIMVTYPTFTWPRGKPVATYVRVTPC